MATFDQSFLSDKHAAMYAQGGNNITPSTFAQNRGLNVSIHAGLPNPHNR